MFQIFVVAICYLTVVQSSYHEHDIQLQSVPDVHSYGKTLYPKQMLHDLGEHYEEHHSPKVIKIIKTLKLEIPKPYPVHVPHKVPYPIPVKIPHIIKVPHVVKIAHPVPVEVVKHVPVHQESNHQEGQQEEGGNYGSHGALSYAQYQDYSSLTGYGGGHDQSNQQQSGQDQGSYSAPQSSYSITHDSYGTPDAYGTIQQSYGAPSTFTPTYNLQSQGDGHSDASASSYPIYTKYPSNDQESSQQNDQGSQSTSASGMDQQEAHSTIQVSSGYQVKDMNDERMDQ